MRKMSNILLVSLITLFVIGCGGGGGSSDTQKKVEVVEPIKPDNPKEKEEEKKELKTAVLIDAKIVGAKYARYDSNGKMVDKKGTTNKNGEFSYYEDEAVKFFVGKIKIGEVAKVPSDKKVFIGDIVGVDRKTTDNAEVLKIATFLQSIDSDDSEDIIDVTEKFEKFEKLKKEVDLSSKEVKITEVKQILTSNDIKPKSEEEVKKHLNKTLVKHEVKTEEEVKQEETKEEDSTSGGSSTSGGNTPVADTIKPIISSTTPQEGATVEADSTITLTLSENITADKSKMTLTKDGVFVTIGAVNTVGKTITITPQNNFVSSSAYKLTIKKEAIKDTSKNTLAKDFVLNFTAEDKTAPVLTFATNNNLDPKNFKYTITSNEKLDKASITKTNVKLTKDGSQDTITYDVAYDEDKTITITSSSLISQKAYTITLNGIKDEHGNTISEQTKSFTTEDKDAPSIKSTSIDDHKTQVGINENIILTVSKEIKKNSLNIKLEKVIVNGTNEDVSLEAIGYNDKKITINPSNALESTTKYKLTIKSGTLIDMLDNSIAHDYELEFTTKDQKAPIVESSDPAENQTGIAKDKAIVLTLSEDVEIDKSKFTLFKDNVNDNLDENKISYANKKITISGITFDSEKTYKLQITADGIKDKSLSKNPLDSNYELSFTIKDYIKPVIDATNSSVTNNDTDVSVSDDIIIKFTESQTLTIDTSKIKFKNKDNNVVANSMITKDIAKKQITIKPTKPLNSKETYTIVIEQGAVSDGTNDLGKQEIAFTTKDAKAPSIVTPDKNVTDIALNESLEITFSEKVTKVDAKIILADNEQGNNPLNTVLSLDSAGKILTVNPDDDFALYSTDYYLIFQDGAIKDEAGNSLASKTIKYTTIANPDNAAPTFTSSTPADNATQVASGSKIKLTASEDISIKDSTKIVLTNVTTNGTVTITPSVENGNVLTITLPDLVSLHVYKLEVKADAVKDTNDNALEVAKIVNFTAEDKTAPVFAKGDTSLSPSAFSYKITSDEGLNADTVKKENITLTKDEDSSTPTYEVAYTNKVITITSSTLESEKDYTITIKQAVTDLYGNHQDEDKTFKFKTIDEANPSITGYTTPSDNTSVSIDSNIVLTVSEDIQKSYISGITLVKTSDNAEVDLTGSGVIAYSSKTITINPSKNLESSTDYKLTVPKSAIVDLSDNTAKDDYVLTFKTKDQQAPTVKSSVPAKNADNIALNTPITVTFDENIKIADTSKIVLSLGGDNINKSINGKTLTITNANLIPNRIYILSLYEGAISDIAGNKNAEISISFTTKTIPTIALTSSTNLGELDHTKPIEIEFSKDIYNFDTDKILVNKGQTTIEETIKSKSGKKISINPNGKLEGGSSYTIFIYKNAISDEYGQNLASNLTISFTTKATDDGWITYDGNKFKLLNSTSSQSGASSACQSAGGTLATKSELGITYSVPSNMTSTLGFQSGNKYWYYDSSYSQTYVLGDGYGSWGSTTWGLSSISAYPICKKNTSTGGGSSGGSVDWVNYNGKKFLVVNIKKNRNNAKSYCQNKGGFLVKDNSQSSWSSFANALSLTSQNYWLDDDALKSNWTTTSWLSSSYKYAFICQKN